MNLSTRLLSDIPKRIQYCSFSSFMIYLLLFGLNSKSLCQMRGDPNKCYECKRTALYQDSFSDDSLMRSEWGTAILLVQAIAGPCFHIRTETDLKAVIPEYPFEIGGNARPAEYLFEAIYEDNLKGDIKSRLTIGLYYDGDAGLEHVKSWITETDNPRASFTLHKNRMFTNSSAELKKSRPTEVLRDFERMLTSCAIEPEKEKVKSDEEIKIKLTSLQDIEGRPSREFNRVLIQSLEGEILGGVEHSVDPALKVLKVGDGFIEFTYKAPESCEKEKDIIYVYNSCDISREDLHPLSKTSLGEKIAEKSLEIICPEYELEIESITEGSSQEGRYQYYNKQEAKGNIPIYVLDEDGSNGGVSKVEGKGILTRIGKGGVLGLDGAFKIIGGQGYDEIVIEGTLEQKQDESSELKLKVKEVRYKQYSGEKVKDPSGEVKDVDYPQLTHEIDLTFPVENGCRIEKDDVAFNNYKFTLYVKSKQ